MTACKTDLKLKHNKEFTTTMETNSEYIFAMPARNYLDGLAPEIKVEIIFHLSNPTPLARCSHAWYAAVNSPATKARWLTYRYGKTHALFHAVKMGEPFINVDVVECLFAQKAHLSRYFIQRLMLGFGKYDSRLIDLKLAHTRRPLDPVRNKLIQNKIRSPWASNLSFDVFSRILKEGHDRFDGNDIPVRGNDMESFYYLSAGPLVISEERKKLKDNINEIERLITTFRFAPFPPRPKIRRHITESTESHSVNYDDYPPTDGYENVRQLNVIARAILIHPDLVNVWKQNGYHEIVDDINDLVMESVLSNFNLNLDQSIQRLIDLHSVGFRLTDEMMGDALILFAKRLNDIGGVLINAFAIVRGITKNNILSICLRELLNPGRKLERYKLLEFILNRVDNPEETAYRALQSYNIGNSVNFHPSRNGSIPQALTLLKYGHKVYYCMLAKFGADSRIATYLMNEITAARIWKAKLHESNRSLVLSSASIDILWQESNTVFNAYYNAGVHFEPQLLSLFKTCPEEAVIACLFEGYLAKLFEYRVGFQPSRVDEIPSLRVIPLSHRKRKTTHEARMEWWHAIRYCNLNDEMTTKFGRQREKFLQNVCGASSASSKRRRLG
ncbi:4932_t:CDS:1 [Paraglomus brasilianum]|uniref:4932_t:CDS:1 n=1 Tax=Paraglomus brasilianum TaxID=144538 RepID=A0A9N9DEQ4_9GLOM|nr:4932_t:CDS:1 [Paraglomus brasilianum]